MTTTLGRLSVIWRQFAPPSQGCKWPSGDVRDGQLHYCGEPVRSGVYCAEHLQLAYTQQPSKSVFVSPEEEKAVVSA